MDLKEEKSFILEGLRCLTLGESFSPFWISQKSGLAALKWEFIINTANSHRILPFLTWVLKNKGRFSELPAPLQARLTENLQRATAENMVKLAEFREINRYFEKEGIPVVPLKGIALTLGVYKDHPFRRMGDIDLLVREEHLDLIQNLLIGLGFILKEGPYRWQTEMANRVVGRGSYLRDGLDIDLQWRPRFYVKGRLRDLRLERTWQRVSPCPTLGRNVFLLSPLDQSRYLLFQMANDLEASVPRLIQLLDLALVIQKGRVPFDSIPDEEDLRDFDSDSLETLHGLLEVVREVFFEPGPQEALSVPSRKILESLYHNSETFQNSFGGKFFLNSPASLLHKLIFFAGYLFPSQSALNWLHHWRGLMKKARDKKLTRATTDSPTQFLGQSAFASLPGRQKT